MPFATTGLRAVVRAVTLTLGRTALNVFPPVYLASRSLVSF